jgi:hypothetical protein
MRSHMAVRTLHAVIQRFWAHMIVVLCRTAVLCTQCLQLSMPTLWYMPTAAANDLLYDQQAILLRYNTIVLQPVVAAPAADI